MILGTVYPFDGLLCAGPYKEVAHKSIYIGGDMLICLQGHRVYLLEVGQHHQFMLDPKVS